MDRQMLNQATASTDEPTPGYIYGEIVKMISKSDDVRYSVTEYLFKKLAKDDPIVKWKTLKILKHVCDKGGVEFKRGAKKPSNVTIIKDCQKYRGNQHPTRGDHYNKLVRSEADLCLAALFAEQQATSQHAHAQRIQGFGSGSVASNAAPANNSSGFGASNSSFGASNTNVGSNFSGGNAGGNVGGYASGGSRMEGFGNPRFDNSKTADGNRGINANLETAAASAAQYSKQGLQVLSAGVGNVFSYLPDNLKDQVERVSGGTVGAHGISSLNNLKSGGDDSPSRGHGHMALPGGSSPGNYNRTGAYQSPAIPQQGNASGYQQPRPPMSSGGPWGGGTNATATVPPPPPQVSAHAGVLEKRLVDTVCAKGGARVAPDAKSLENFCQQCESLDAAIVGELLAEKLKSSDWQIKTKVLHVCDVRF